MQTLANKIVQSVVIKTPCSIGWENMEGNDKVRFCQQCNLNVHNLSNMSDIEAAAILTSKKKGRLCVFVRQRADGTIVTDNCPEKLKKVRNYIQACAAASLMTITYWWTLGSSSTGLNGTAVDPRFGLTGEIGGLADYGYDNARNITRFLTAFSFSLAFFAPMDPKKASKLKLVWIELIALAFIPILVHLSGTFLIDREYGGFGGGL